MSKNINQYKYWSKVLYLISALFLFHSSPLLFADENKINMVVTAAFVSDKGIPVYDELANYISKKLSKPTAIISGISYEESNLLLNQGIIQVGFVCGLPYVQNSDTQTLLAIPVMAGKKDDFPDTPGYENVPGKYFSYTIVRKDSPIKSWQELKGKSYVYNEQESNSGYNMPRYKLIQLGANSWEDYFSKVMVSGSHEESIRMVARGLVDASSVDSMVLDYDRHIGNADAWNVKVIEALFPGGAGIPPVVLSKKADPELFTQLQSVLLNMHKDPEGKKILDKAMMLRFDPPNDANYDDVRHMELAAKQAGFRDHQE